MMCDCVCPFQRLCRRECAGLSSPDEAQQEEVLNPIYASVEMSKMSAAGAPARSGGAGSAGGGERNGGGGGGGGDGGEGPDDAKSRRQRTRAQGAKFRCNVRAALAKADLQQL